MCNISNSYQIRNKKIQKEEQVSLQEENIHTNLSNEFLRKRPIRDPGGLKQMLCIYHFHVLKKNLVTTSMLTLI